MDSTTRIPDDLLDPPQRIFERLRHIAGYTWDEQKDPFHSTYDFWHIFGSRHMSTASAFSTSSQNVSSPASVTRLPSGGPSPSERSGSFDYPTSAASQDATPDESPSFSGDMLSVDEPVVARISYHGLREERAFQITRSLTTSADPEGNHIAKPIDLVRLTPLPGDRGPITVAIYHYLGKDYIWNVLDMGPAFFRARKYNDAWKGYRNPNFKLQPPISLEHFLDFAIGVTECLEILHHRHGIVHGEIRSDAFHFNLEENKVRVLSFGSGIRSFEHGLTSIGWSTLSQELGARHKLLYISPEQTGRMPAEPDSRTDIYAIGVLFWQLLTQKPVFEGDTPLDIVQGVLGRKIPSVSDVRIDIPDVIGRIIQRCTAKNISDRYNSASGLRHDLMAIQHLLGVGDVAGIEQFQIGSKDVSSFFMLPTTMIGRQKEKNEVLRVIDRVAKSHAVGRKLATSRFADGSVLSTDGQGVDDVSSEGASSLDGVNRQSGSFTQTVSTDPSRQRTPQQSFQSDAHTISGDTASSQSTAHARGVQPFERHHSISIEARSLADSIGTDTRPSIGESSVGGLSRQLGTAKFRRRGHCEVITIEGAGGLGKSCLVQNVLSQARRRGYCATAKFDTSRRTPFGPLIKLFSALFKQVWGERNTETPFHQGLKQYIGPVWPCLWKTLGLPEFLFGPPDASSVVARSISSSQGSLSRNGRGARQRRGSSPDRLSPAPLTRNPSIASQSTQDFLRAGAATKSTRLMNIFLDVLRVFTAHKFICFCLDDLHFADDESLELISQIIGTRMRMAIILTYRPDELPAEKVHQILYSSDVDESRRQGAANITRISLASLTEADIVEYVSKTLCRNEDEVLPLALVIQSKTAGNPFYIREMLSACHRKKCIWYDYKDNMWHYDLDRLFEQFRGEKDYDVLDTGFITSRLDELRSAARELLAWAALLGNTFSFELVSRLMSGEFPVEDPDNPSCCSTGRKRKYSQHEAIAGLQSAIQAYIIVATEHDDRFRFAHDRYIHAASKLKECSARRMHFSIAQTLMKYYIDDTRLWDTTAFHICQAVDITRAQVSIRRPFRKVLIDRALASAENGARPTACRLYENAIKLLQDSPWDSSQEDGSYEETIQLYLRSAECHIFMGQHQRAHEVLAVIFRNAKTAVDRAPAYVLQSRVFSQSSNVEAAVVALRECLATLDVELDDEPTYEKCDEKFEILSARILTTNRATLMNLDHAEDCNLASIGAVLSETCSTAWWSDCLRYYYLTMVMMETHLDKGAFPQSGMAFLHFAVIALARWNRAQFAVDIGRISQEILHRAKDPFSIARGLMLYPCLLGHLTNSMPASLVQMEDAVDFASAAGDRMSTILSYGLHAVIKFYSSENFAELEAFCQYGCEDVASWTNDTRGGVLLLVMQQVCRALQGKTHTDNPLDVLGDEHHNVLKYKTWLDATVHHSNRSTLLYESLELVPLFLFGHYDQAVQVGERCVANLSMLWTVRNSRLILLFYGLARAGQLFNKMQDPRYQSQDHGAEIEDVLADLRKLTQMIKDWGAVSDINYFAWHTLLDAQTVELAGFHGEAVRHYEEALDHATEHDLTFEEALGNYLMAGFFVRRKARRSARSALVEALGLYRKLAATGVAAAIEEQHSLLLHGPTRNHMMVDATAQTDFVTDTAPGQFRQANGEIGAELAPATSNNNLTEITGERVADWGRSVNVQAEGGAGLPTLDMIDLHAILHSSQVISSVLRVDHLLKTMCDIILQTCGGSATLAAIVVREQVHAPHDPRKDKWVIAASGDPEQGASSHQPGLSMSEESLIAENVVLYCTRFMEVVFVSDLGNDERFGNVSESWLQKNPAGKAIIAIPITHGKDETGKDMLHGVLYLEGESGSFTDRNVSVVQLLVMQLGISYSNAVAMMNIEKISAKNKSMVEVQRKALAKAVAAEQKAKDAEAEAKRNVKLAEEAAKAKSIFLANVSHELRTPLNGVIGNSELLRDSQLNREQMEMADSIRVSADLLLTVINDILDFSKMEADKMKLYVIAFNPEEMIKEVVRAVSYSNREKTSKKNVSIVQSVDLPSMLIFGDPIRLHQVLGNLIGNSLKFTENGSITIGAKLDSETEESATLTFWVRDTGIGIPPQQLAKLFQPFSQADASTARKYGGSGLGLSICKSLIQTMMRGKIELESEENVGTTAWFTVTFDKANSNVSAGDVQSKSRSNHAERSSAATAVEGGRSASPNPYLDLSTMSKEDLRICVAEDNPINQRIAIQYTKRLGYTNIMAYENGLVAVEGLRQKAREGNPYHVVLMDVQMPVLDGYEATRLIRKDPLEAVRKVLVIAMTASAIQGDREKCIAAGMNDYLAKPVRADVLKNKLDAYLTKQVSSIGVERTLTD
ncbi:putative histidine kinase HHK1p [Emericellopsis atlantica]|uniref:histidine kinase n=1 Tax=Emericellopsis atlantica TaxID=2614577 RepID=A0A9P7ZWW6_9HYPO|nr:putative histidine kinase HHK1p [Emericellopsis atlantica]KAG9258980.1 putative histidine kinase HHK1p [Emericellopsis atlantica]